MDMAIVMMAITPLSVLLRITLISWCDQAALVRIWQVLSNFGLDLISPISPGSIWDSGVGVSFSVSCLVC